MKKIYLCNVDTLCPDYILANEILRQYESNIEILGELNNADIAVFTAGTFLRTQNTATVLAEFEKAKADNKTVAVIKPHGSKYMPMKMRGENVIALECEFSSIHAFCKEVK